MAPDLKDFREQLQRRCAEAIRGVGTKSAQTFAEAARRGGLGSSRLVFPLVDALEAGWRQLIEHAIGDARAYHAATKVRRSDLAEELTGQLMASLPLMIERSRIDRPSNGFPVPGVPLEVRNRIAELEPYLELRLRQFEQAIGEAIKPGKVGTFIRDLGIQTIAGIAVVAIVAIIGMLWALL